MTMEELDERLRREIAAGEITADEAENEWHDYFDRACDESPYYNW